MVMWDLVNRNQGALIPWQIQGALYFIGAPEYKKVQNVYTLATF